MRVRQPLSTVVLRHNKTINSQLILIVIQLTYLLDVGYKPFYLAMSLQIECNSELEESNSEVSLLFYLNFDCLCGHHDNIIREIAQQKINTIQQ